MNRMFQKILKENDESLINEPQLSNEILAECKELCDQFGIMATFPLPFPENFGAQGNEEIIDVMQEEATEDAQRLAAVQPLDDSYLETPIPVIAWKRGGWLLFLAFVALMTAQVLKHYEETSLALEWIVLFLPLVLASGGNAGSSSGSISVAHTSSKGSCRVRHVRASFVSDGSGPACHVRAVRTLIPAAAAAASWVFPSAIFFLSSRTCASVTNLGRPRPKRHMRVLLAWTGKSSCRQPAKVIVADHSVPRLALHPRWAGMRFSSSSSPPCD